MGLLKRAQKSLALLFNAVVLVACGIAIPVPTATMTTPSFTQFIPSITPTIVSSPTNTSTATPEPDIAPNCKIANEAGQLYLLSDYEFRDLRTTEGKLDQALSTHYPEWANYTQTVPWSTEPVKLGEIIVSASLDLEKDIQVNPAVTLVALGESLDWQLPSNMDLYLKAKEISTELNRLSLD